MSDSPRRQLGLFDAVAIIVGIMIGSGIYILPPMIAGNVAGPEWLIVAWIIGGVLAAIGALCYAELATLFPREGGDYIFLSRAFGRRVGFVFAWAEFWIIRPNNIGAVAFVMASYAQRILPLHLGNLDAMIYAGSAVAITTLINILGVKTGKRTQNILTVLKALGLLSIFVVAICFAAAPATNLAIVDGAAGATTASDDASDAWVIGPMAMVFIMFAYGGWNDVSYVAAEVRQSERNMLRALLLGIASTALIYVLVNIAFLRVLGFEGLKQSSAVADEVLKRTLGDFGGIAISLIVVVSCLGAINGMVLTGSRIYYAVGAEHAWYRWLGKWNGRLDSPLRSLLMQGAISLGVIIWLGFDDGGFKRMLEFSAPVFWFFFFLAGVSLFVFRARLPASRRAYSVAFYPVTPILFCATALFLFYFSAKYSLTLKSPLLWVSGAILAIGVVLAMIEKPESESND